MFLTRTSSSWPRSKVVVRTSLAYIRKPAEHLGVGPRDPARRGLQTLAVGVLADREQQLTNGGLGALVVEVGNLPVTGQRHRVDRPPRSPIVGPSGGPGGGDPGGPVGGWLGSPGKRRLTGLATGRHGDLTRRLGATVEATRAR